MTSALSMLSAITVSMKSTVYSFMMKLGMVLIGYTWFSLIVTMLCCCCWLGGRKGIWPVKTEWWGANVIICLGRGADLRMAHLMPLPLTISCSSKSRLVLPLWYRLTQVFPDKRPLNGCCCCCCCCNYAGRTMQDFCWKSLTRGWLFICCEFCRQVQLELTVGVSFFCLQGMLWIVFLAQMLQLFMWFVQNGC